MSIIERAKIELSAINFGEEDTTVMIGILQKFFDQWDSGGAVSIAAPVLMRLIKGQPLSPLTGDDSEWHDPMGDGHMLQNVRCSTIFRDGKDGMAYDIDVPGRPPITFPHDPTTRLPGSPVFEVSAKDA